MCEFLAKNSWYMLPTLEWVDKQDDPGKVAPVHRPLMGKAAEFVDYDAGAWLKLRCEGQQLSMPFSWLKLINWNGTPWKVDCGSRAEFDVLWAAAEERPVSSSRTNLQYMYYVPGGAFAWGSNPSEFKDNTLDYTEIPLHLAQELLGRSPTTEPATPFTIIWACSCSSNELATGFFSARCEYHRKSERPRTGTKGLGIQITPRSHPELYSKQEIQDWWEKQ
jgi:hypothetical protein